MTHKKNPNKIVFAKTTIERIDFMIDYTHFTTDERKKILFYLAQSKSFGFIAKELNRSKSSISREIKRNSEAKGAYSPFNPSTEGYTQVYWKKAFYQKDNVALFASLDTVGKHVM